LDHRRLRLVDSGVPSKNYKLPTEWIQPGTIVVNVASDKNVDEAAIMQVRTRPVPEPNAVKV
jgi:methylenetetrahydrofolate dehydrogenase (NAD+)